MALTARFTPATLESALKAIQHYGYEVAVKADQFGDNQYLVVQDPVHSSGHGASAGKLVLTGYEPTILRSYGMVRAFINARH